MLFGACRGGFKAKATCCDTRMSAIHVRLGQFTIAGLLENAAETWFKVPTFQFQKRAHNPLLIAAGVHRTDVPIPWLGDKRLRLALG